MTEDVTLPGNGVRLRAELAGPPDGPMVVLLHGFPECSFGWRKQIGSLAEAGFRVVALNQRGYDRSDKPPRVADYAVDRLAADVIAVLDASKAERADVVGHDWGGGVAWWLAVRHPDRVRKLAVLNCPHPLAMRVALTSSVGQMARSWYIAAAQIPGLPEWVARVTRFGVFERSMRTTSRPGTFTAADIARYRESWSQPGAITGMVNWYRALRYPPADPPSYRVRVPTMLIWGERDRFLGRPLCDASAALCDDVRVERLPHATHWVPHEEPDRVNRLLVAFFGQ